MVSHVDGSSHCTTAAKKTSDYVLHTSELRADVSVCRLAEHFQPSDVIAQLDLYSPPERAPCQTSLLLLLPIVLGVDRLNEVYARQLQDVLRMEQSTGIVGGRPGHSCYFIGYQVPLGCSCHLTT